MKKWGFLLLFLLGLGFALLNKVPLFQNKVEIQKYAQNDEGQLGESITSENIQTKMITITKDQVYQGDLLLINDKYPVHQDSVKSDIVNVSKHDEWVEGFGLLSPNIYMSKEIARKFSEMVSDADRDGVNHFLIDSGYRSFSEQDKLFNEMGASYALPAGFSEHNSGLALDVGSSLTKMESAPEGQWLKENAWKYGFILRYPKDKTDVTRIQYEPWHFRYVGLPHSAIMKEKNFALEEYMDFLKDQKVISTTIDGEKYEVSYYPVKKDRSIQVPTNLNWEVSGNNVDGVIVTVFPGSTTS